MIEGESNFIRHESSKPRLLKDRAWLSWELSGQGQDKGGSELARYGFMVSSRFLRTCHRWSWYRKATSIDANKL